jgi:general secretion pathway protein I
MRRVENGEEGRETQAGFSLTEVIVALAILALLLGGLVGLLSDGLRRTGEAEATVQAASLAQSLLARLGTELPLQDGVTTGELAHGYRWRLSVAPYGDVADRKAWPVAAYSVSVEIHWGEANEQHSIALTTLRLGPKGEAQR